MRDLFKSVKMDENNPKWKNAIKREKELYSRNNDIRSEFERDYTRIIHSTAYRRLKHKTQVFFSPKNDHICTRIEHVTHVESISQTIAKYLGLNTELTKAIATGHDIGHSPFGHQGETVLSEISKREIGETFWHERNGVILADQIELLEDDMKNKQNLDLCYAVRDGIISHCGEVDENNLKPREDNIDLYLYKKPGEYAPYTWEGCVVKISDKIAYLGRDIEDAITLGILDEHLEELYKILGDTSDIKINNTVIINYLISDLCENSSPEKGLCFSEKGFEIMNKIKKFNIKNIYCSERLKQSHKYFEIIINCIYETLQKCYDGNNTKNQIENMKKIFPDVITDFESWLEMYWNLERNEIQKNDVIFDINKKQDFKKAIILYISGMTDNFAIDTYNKIISF